MTRLTTRRLEEINKLQTAARTAANQNVAGGGMNAGSLNVMFQAQDIAMMAASGQNVMVTALQQGTQLAGGLQQVQQAGQSMTQTLLGGFAALLNPLSLVTIGTVALSAAVIKYGSAWLTSGEQAELTLEEQNHTAGRFE